MGEDQKSSRVKIVSKLLEDLAISVLSGGAHDVGSMTDIMIDHLLTHYDIPRLNPDEVTDTSTSTLQDEVTHLKLSIDVERRTLESIKHKKSVVLYMQYYFRPFLVDLNY